ncbi:sterol 14-demethylase [Aureococcus anophagefferens]|nr:sterol 14-demethylase [Aureococcus anophagefferens]
MALVVIAAAVFCLTCCLWMLMSGKFRPAKAPPHVSEGPPIVGNLMGFALGPRGPLDFIKRNFEVHGGAYSMRVAHKTLTFLVGPKASAPFFQNRDGVFSQPEVYGFMTQVFGKGVVYDATPAKRKAQNVHMSRGLRADRLKSYIPKILMETKKYMGDRWAEDGACDVLKALSELTILTASRCLHGDDVRETLFEEVADIYHDLDKGITPLSFFWPTAPVEGHRKRDAARVRMVELFRGVIDARRTQTREQADARTDILQARLLEEQRQIFGAGDIRDAPMSFDDLNKMEILHNCVKETLRMHPPLIMLMRKAMQDVPIETDAGLKYVIPKGDIVFTSPAVAGRLDMVFKDPDAFDPDRYAPPREEHATPFAHLGFGGGIHQCMGQQFGFMQVKTIISWLLRNYDMEPAGPCPRRTTRPWRGSATSRRGGGRRGAAPRRRRRRRRRRGRGGDRRGEAEIPAGDGDGDDDAGVAEAKVEVAEEAEVLVPTPSPDAPAVPAALRRRRREPRAADAEESFPTIHGTKYYVAQTKVLSDERVTISRVGRWFRDVRELASSPRTTATLAPAPGRATADYPPEPGVARAAAAASAEPASPRDANAICGGEWREGPAHDADIDIGVGDLVRFRLRGAATVDEYGVVLWVSKASTDAGSRNAGAHVQVCTHACGMLVPRHEIAFGVSRLYGDVIDVLLKDFSMEIQLRPNKFLFIFEPDAVVFPTLAYSTGVDVHDGAAPGGAADGPGEGA